MEKPISLHVLWAFLADNVVSIYVFEFMPVYKLVRHYLKGGGLHGGRGEERRGGGEWLLRSCLTSLTSFVFQVLWFLSKSEHMQIGN